MSSNPLNTPKGFRYPIYTDSPDVPRDLQNLAGDVDAYLSINKGPGYLVFSQSSVAMATGSITFLTPKNSGYNPNGTGAYAAGNRVRIIYTTTPSIFMEGVITSVVADTSITVNVDTLSGSGTYASWQFSLAGIQGLQGPQGLQGVQGLQGPQGVQGTQGLQGTQGFQGLQGLQGVQGAQGLQGVQGAQGLQGKQGVQGLQGPQGIQGLQGPQGTQGLQGLQGLQGVQGTQGPQGVQGSQGVQGNQGLQGLQGVQGIQGIQGVQGPISSLNSHQSVHAVSNSALPNSPSYIAGSTDLNGGTGIGAYLQATINQALVIDGYTVTVGDRVLINGQSNKTTNGIYVVTATGSASAVWKLTRASDYDDSTAGEVSEGDYVYVLHGTNYAGTSWIMIVDGSNSDGTTKIGTDNIYFSQTAGTGAQGLTGAQGAGGTVAYWGGFLSTQNQTAASANTAYAISYNTTFQANGVSISNDTNGNPTKINFQYGGTYQSAVQPQFSNTGNQPANVTVWATINGSTPAPNSATVITVPAKFNSTIPGQVLENVLLTGPFNAGDYLQFWWSTASTNVSLAYTAAGTTPTTPASPSVFLVVSQVAYAIQGTQGLQGLQGLQGVQGLQGAQGLQGLQGVQGIQGAQGLQGLQGLQGFGYAQLQGLQGAAGAQGTAGFVGSNGAQGIQGFQGIIGGGLWTEAQSTNPPSNAVLGNRWYNTDNGREYTYIQSTTGTQSYQWVDTRATGYLGVQGIQGYTGSNGIQGTSGQVNSLTINNGVSTSAYTLLSTDVNGLVITSSTNAVTITVPPSVFSIGQVITVQQGAAGQITFAQGSGVTITSNGATASSPRTRVQYSACSVICTASNTFTIIGDIY